MADREERKNNGGGSSAVVPLLAFAAGAVAGLVTYFGVFGTIEEEERLARSTAHSTSGSASTPSSATNRKTLQQWIDENRGKPVSEEAEPVPEIAACQICLNERRKVTHTFKCGHATCLECAVNIAQNFQKCPFDQTPVLTPPKLLRLI